jgi:hypothetical protein
MRIIAFVLDRPTIERILDHIGEVGLRRRQASRQRWVTVPGEAAERSHAGA